MYFVLGCDALFDDGIFFTGAHACCYGWGAGRAVYVDFKDNCVYSVYFVKKGQDVDVRGAFIFY